jgi:molybdopterin converting factor small subunit
MEVLFFGKLQELAGTGRMECSTGSDTDALQQELFVKFPRLSGLPFLIAVNRELVHSNTILQPGDTVALLPPYAGG